jgi:hypothetical protein
MGHVYQAGSPLEGLLRDPGLAWRGVLLKVQVLWTSTIRTQQVYQFFENSGPDPLLLHCHAIALIDAQGFFPGSELWGLWGKCPAQLKRDCGFFLHTSFQGIRQERIRLNVPTLRA